jgi:hypothetical protein
LKAHAEAIRGFLADLQAATQFYLDRPAQARQLLIDKKFIRVSADIYAQMQDYDRDPKMRVDVGALEKMQRRINFLGLDLVNRDSTGWLGREDSNLRMAESKLHIPSFSKFLRVSSRLYLFEIMLFRLATCSRLLPALSFRGVARW